MMNLNELKIFIDGTPANTIAWEMLHRAVSIESNEAAVAALNVFKDWGFPVEEDGETLVHQALQYSGPDARITFMQFNMLDDMYIITCVISTPEAPYETEEQLVDPMGAFGYVINLTVPYFSELGYSFFEASEDGIKRVA